MVAASRCVNSVMRHLQVRLSEEANPVTGGRMAQLPYTSERAVCLASPKSSQGWNALHYPLCASRPHSTSGAGVPTSLRQQAATVAAIHDFVIWSRWSAQRCSASRISPAYRARL